MEYSYYHGTSTLFLPSILANGLGGINPNIKYQTIQLLRHLYFDCEKFLLDNEEFRKHARTTVAMINQESIDIEIDNQVQAFHFRHHVIYVSHHEYTAVKHAVINKYGSEIVCRLSLLFSLLKSKIQDYQLPNELDKIGLNKIMSKEYQPVLIKTKPLDHTYLAKEDSKTSKEALELMKAVERFAPKDTYELLSQYANFELLKPLPPQDLSFFLINYYGEIRKPKSFKYQLNKLV